MVAGPEKSKSRAQSLVPSITLVKSTYMPEEQAARD